MRRSGRRAEWMRYRWPILAVLAVVGLVLGYIGFVRYSSMHHARYSVVDVIYADLTLLRPEPWREPPFPWQLQVARFLLPAILLLGAFSAVFVLFRDRFEQARLPFLRDHVIVAGLGVMGISFVKALREDRRTVVVIESDSGNPNLASASEAGAIVVVGDATDRDVLDAAGVRKAHHLIATADDATNAELAIQARALKQDGRGNVLECLAHIVDPDLCTLLKRETLMDGGERGFRLDFFNFYDHAARRVCETTLRPDDRVVTVGDGPLSDQIVVHVASSVATGSEPVEVTVTGDHAVARVAALTGQYPYLGTVAHLHSLEVAPNAAALYAAGVLDAHAGPTTIYISDVEGGTALEVALGLRALAAASHSRIVVCTDRADGLARVLSTNGRGSEDEPVVVLALAREACTSDLVDRGIHELLGRTIHENYRTARRAEGARDDDPSLASWLDLPETLRESNRAQAADIGAKLRTVGCDLVPSGPRPSGFEFTDAEVELLGRREHDRWADERRRDGWRLGGERDPVARTTPYLVGWEQLTEDIRDRDRETIRRLPQVVSAAGFRIVRLDPALGRGPAG